MKHEFLHASKYPDIVGVITTRAREREQREGQQDHPAQRLTLHETQGTLT